MLGKIAVFAWRRILEEAPTPGVFLRKDVKGKELRVEMAQGCHSKEFTRGCGGTEPVMMIPKWERSGGSDLIHETV
jgi:hypothetical protein